MLQLKIGDKVFDAFGRRAVIVEGPKPAEPTHPGYDPLEVMIEREERYKWGWENQLAEFIEFLIQLEDDEDSQGEDTEMWQLACYLIPRE